MSRYLVKTTIYYTYKRCSFQTVSGESDLRFIIFSILRTLALFYLILPSELESNRIELFSLISWLSFTKSLQCNKICCVWLDIITSWMSNVLQQRTAKLFLNLTIGVTTCSPNLLIQVFNNWIYWKYCPGWDWCLH